MTSTHSGWRGRRWCWSVQQTTRQRVPQCTIAGNRAKQSPTKGAVCRPSRHRLSDEVFPATHESSNTRGTAEFTTMPRVKRQFKATELWRQRPLHAQRAEGRGASGAGRPPDHAQRTRGSARGRANSSSRQRKPLTNQGTTLRRRCGNGARGARLTHSQAATPGS